MERGPQTLFHARSSPTPQRLLLAAHTLEHHLHEAAKRQMYTSSLSYILQPPFSRPSLGRPADPSHRRRRRTRERHGSGPVSHGLPVEPHGRDDGDVPQLVGRADVPTAGGEALGELFTGPGGTRALGSANEQARGQQGEEGTHLLGVEGEADGVRCDGGDDRAWVRRGERASERTVHAVGIHARPRERQRERETGEPTHCRTTPSHSNHRSTHGATPARPRSPQASKRRRRASACARAR